MGKFDGSAAVVTGASSGIGRATAIALAKEGCDLVITARRKERLEEVKAICEGYGVKVVYYVGDAREEATAVNTIDLAIENFGKIDILVNNCGIGRLQKITETTMEEYDLIMESNCRSAFAFAKYTVPHMLEKNYGFIMIVSSITGYIGHEDEAAYTMSKFAVRGLAQALDKELVHTGIKTCSICPTATSTEFEVGFGRTQEQVTTGAWTQAEDIADAIVYACSQKGRSKVTEVRFT